MIVAAAMLGGPPPAGARDAAAPPSTLPALPGPSDGLVRPRAVPSVTGDDVRVSDAPEQALAEVTLDVNPLNPANLAICGYARDLKSMSTFHSFDAGRTWRYVPVGDAHDGLGPGVDRFDPTLVFDARGYLYVGYGARVPVGDGFSDHLVVCRSVDGGRSFGPGVFVWVAPNVGVNAGNDKFHLAAGPDRFDPSLEVVGIAWTWNVRPQFGSVDQQIAFSRSVDAGLSFSPPVVINDDSFLARDFAIFADPAIGPDGVLYVAWNDLNTNDLRVDHSFDNGITWGVDVIVEGAALPFRTRIPPQPNRGVFAGPVLDVDRSDGVHHGRVYLVYCHGTTDDTDVLVRFSDDRANSWSPPVRVNDDPPGSFQFLPWLDVNQTSGRVNVVFYDTREDPVNHRSRVHLAASDDGGGSFLRNVPVADELSNNGVSNPARYPGNFLEYIGVAGWGDDAFIAWTDTRNAPAPLTDYYFDRVTGDETPPEISVTLDRDVLWPPDGRWEEVRAEVTISGGSEPNPTFVLHSVTHDEGPADGDILDAEVGTPDLSFRLRAARRGKGDGRVYTVVYRAEGAWGGIARDSAFVFVPHDADRAPAAASRRPSGGAPCIRSVAPNPVRASAVIRFETAAAGHVRLAVYDVRGRLAAVLDDGFRPAGEHAVQWDGTGGRERGGASPLASGVYILRLEAGGTRSSHRFVLLR